MNLKDGEAEEALAETFAQAHLELAVHNIDQGLHCEAELQDSGALAMWVAVGLEGMTVAAVALRAFREAFQNRKVPNLADLLSHDYQTAKFPRLVDRAKDLHPDAPYPPDGAAFMGVVRNKLLHHGTTRAVALAPSTLRLVVQVAEWLRALPFNDRAVDRQFHVLAQAGTVKEFPDALVSGVRTLAERKADLLSTSLAAGNWDDTPELRAVAEQERNGLLEILQVITEEPRDS